MALFDLSEEEMCGPCWLVVTAAWLRPQLPPLASSMDNVKEEEICPDLARKVYIAHTQGHEDIWLTIYAGGAKGTLPNIYLRTMIGLHTHKTLREA